MKLILIVILCITLSGCAWFRKSAIEFSQEDLATSQTIKEMGKNYIDGWEPYSGLARCGLGGAYDETPIGITAAKMDVLVKAEKEWDSHAEAAGCAVGLKMKLLEKSLEALIGRITTIVQQYGPLVGL